MARIGEGWREQFANEALLPQDADTQSKAARGKRLERIFFDLLDEEMLQPRLGYRPTGEEVDGSFLLDGRTLLLELKWRQAPQPASTLYQFMGKVAGKLAGTLGVFVSMSGYSSDAVDALVVGKELNLVLMDGEDVRAIARGDVNFETVLRRKLRAAAESGTPYVPWNELSEVLGSARGGRQVVLTESKLDEQIVRYLVDRYGTHSADQSFLSVAGPRNFAPVAATLTPLMASPAELVVVAESEGDGDRTRHRIEADFAEKVPDTKATVVMVHPALEVLVGLFGPNEYSEGRRRVLRLSDELLGQQLNAKLPEAVARFGSQLAPLAKVLRLQLPTQASPEA